MRSSSPDASRPCETTELCGLGRNHRGPCEADAIKALEQQLNEADLVAYVRPESKQANVVDHNPNRALIDAMDAWSKDENEEPWPPTEPLRSSSASVSQHGGVDFVAGSGSCTSESTSTATHADNMSTANATAAGSDGSSQPTVAADTRASDADGSRQATSDASHALESNSPNGDYQAAGRSRFHLRESSSADLDSLERLALIAHAAEMRSYWPGTVFDWERCTESEKDAYRAIAKAVRDAVMAGFNKPENVAKYRNSVIASVDEAQRERDAALADHGRALIRSIALTQERDAALARVAELEREREREIADQCEAFNRACDEIRKDRDAWRARTEAAETNHAGALAAVKHSDQQRDVWKERAESLAKLGACFDHEKCLKEMADDYHESLGQALDRAMNAERLAEQAMTEGLAACEKLRRSRDNYQALAVQYDKDATSAETSDSRRRIENFELHARVNEAELRRIDAERLAADALKYGLEAAESERARAVWVTRCWDTDVENFRHETRRLRKRVNKLVRKLRTSRCHEELHFRAHQRYAVQNAQLRSWSLRWKRLARAMRPVVVASLEFREACEHSSDDEIADAGNRHDDAVDAYRARKRGVR